MKVYVSKTLSFCLFMVRVLTVMISMGVSSPSFAAYDFSYSGRLVDTTGRPLAGPVALKVGFFHSANATTSVLDVTTGLDNVTLKDGVFQIVLTLDDSEFHRVFPSVSQAVYIEVTDLTNSPSSPYARQQLTILPYAGKIPVDSSQFTWSSEGKLQMLSTGADASATATLTNKTIDASANTITGISNTNISATAAIDDSKLATVSTAGKVSGSAITSGTIAGSTAVSTSGSISTTGKVGVGAAAGTSQLEVRGAGTSSATSSLNVMDSGGGSRLYVRDDGNVGIGTTNPGKSIDVAKDFAVNDGLRLLDASGGYFQVTQSTGTVGAFQPVFQGSATGDVSSLIFKGLRSGTATDGTAGTGTIRFITRESDDSSAIGNSDKAFSFENGGNALATILGNGNVGIGTTSPTGITNGKILNIKNASTGIGTHASLVLEGSNAAKFLTLYSGDDTVGGDPALSWLNTDSLRFGTATNTAAVGFSEKVRITSNGNVGIGTTSPDNTLHVHKGTAGSLTGNANAPLVVENSTHAYLNFLTPNANESGILFGNVADVNAGGVIYNNSGTANGLQFRTNGNSTKMVLDSGGKVGIGTSSPSHAISIERSDTSGGSTGPAIALKNINPSDPGGVGYNIAWSNYIAGNGAVAAQFAANYGTGAALPWSSGSGFYLTTRTNHPIIFGTGSTWSENMRIATTGNVGIGTTSPQEKLHVNGRIRVDTLAAAAATAVCIDGSNTLASCSSSRRYKEDIKPLGLGLDAVMTMRPVTFKWLNRDEQDLGFIAEEMHEISPLLNNYRDGKIEGVKYGQVTAVLVNAVQELKIFVDRLFSRQDSRLSTMEAENSRLKAEVNRLRVISEQLSAKADHSQADNAAMKDYLCSANPEAPFCVSH